MTDSNSIAPAEPVEILLAEDEPSDADLCLRAPRRKKVANHIVWVKDGAEALDFLFARGPYADRFTGNCANTGSPALMIH